MIKRIVCKVVNSTALDQGGVGLRDINRLNNKRRNLCDNAGVDAGPGLDLGRAAETDNPGFGQLIYGLRMRSAGEPVRAVGEGQVVDYYA